VSPRWLIVRRFVPSLPLVAAALTVGCGGAKDANAPSYAQPTGQQAYPQPNARPGPPPPPPGQPLESEVRPSTPPVGPSPTPLPGSKSVGTTERDLSTVEGALAALDEEELRLEQMLDEQTIQLGKKSTCGRVCDALASMRRAADAICQLAGDDDDRCGSAQDKVDSNETRVSEAGCSCE